MKKIWELIKKWWAKIKASNTTTTPTNTTDTPTDTTTTTSEYYTVERGKNVEKELKTPCRLSFDITGMGPTSDQVEAHLAWAVEAGKDWEGGNPQPNKEVYAVSAKDYKLKCNGFGESAFYSAGGGWQKNSIYHFLLEIDKNETREQISYNNIVYASAKVMVKAPERVTVGYGWPPTKRNGVDGAKLSNIKFEEL